VIVLLVPESPATSNAVATFATRFVAKVCAALCALEAAPKESKVFAVTAIVGVEPSPELFVRVIAVPATKLET
jgi:hypothetical protein